MVTLKRMPVNRLAVMHRLRPSLCTRQLSWRFRSRAVLEDIGPWLAAQGRGDGEGWTAANLGVGIVTADAPDGRVELAHSPSIIVCVCLLFIKLSPAIVSESLPHNVPKGLSLFIHSLVLCSTGLRLSYISLHLNQWL